MASPRRNSKSNKPASSSSSRPAPARVHTSYVATRVRNKLQDAAAAPDWNLSRLVAHANTLDTLAIRLSDRDRDRKKQQELEEEKAKSEEAKVSKDAPSADDTASRNSREEGVPKEEEEEAFSDHNSDTKEDDFSESDPDWTSTEPSTSLEHADQADYFGSVASAPIESSQPELKLPFVVVTQIPPDNSVQSA